MTPIHEQLYRFIRTFRRDYFGLMPDKIQMHIDDYRTLIGTHHAEAGGWLHFDYRSQSIYEGTTFMSIPIEVSVHDPWVYITAYCEHEGEVQEYFQLENVERRSTSEPKSSKHYRYRTFSRGGMTTGP